MLRVARSLALVIATALASSCKESPPPGIAVGQRVAVVFKDGNSRSGTVAEIDGWMVKLDGSTSAWVNLREASSWHEKVERPPILFDTSRPDMLDMAIIKGVKERGETPTPEMVNRVRARMGLPPTSWTGYGD